MGPDDEATFEPIHRKKNVQYVKRIPVKLIRCVQHQKHCYQTKNKALQVKNVLEKHHTLKLYVYRCKRCDFWHLSKQPPRNK